MYACVSWISRYCSECRAVGLCIILAPEQIQWMCRDIWPFTHSICCHDLLITSFLQCECGSPPPRVSIVEWRKEHWANVATVPYLSWSFFHADSACSVNLVLNRFWLTRIPFPLIVVYLQMIDYKDISVGMLAKWTGEISNPLVGTVV